MSNFTIDAQNLRWIDDSLDDSKDLCLHGDAVAVIGDSKLQYHATVSATALYLLRSLTEDHNIGEENQMLPCCGHFMIPDDELQNVTIVGCPDGIDWEIRHDKDNVIIKLEDGGTATVPYSEYKEEVYRFADKIKEFYDKCSPKKLTEGEFETNAYKAFWNEWNRRRNS